MSNPNSDWPDYLPGPRENIFALGVISLAFSGLELLFETLFQKATQIPQPQVDVLFPKIQNDVRIAIFERAVELREWPEKLKADMLYFSKGYSICVSNRHTLMHASSGGYRVPDGAIMLRRVAEV